MDKAPRLLYLNDSDDSGLLKNALFVHGMEPELCIVRTLPQYLTEIEHDDYDAILSDDGVPGFDGMSALTAARAKQPHIPFIIVSNEYDLQTLERFYAVGVDAHVFKTQLWQTASVISRVLSSKAYPNEQSEASRHMQDSERLVAVVQELSLARDLASVMVIVRRAARRLTGADGANFILREGDLCFHADEDAIAPLWKGKRFPLSACVSGWVMTHRQAAVVDDVFNDPRVPADIYRPTFVKSLAMVPIRSVAPIGAIGNFWAAPHHVTSHELSMLQALADSTSIALENIRLYTELEQRVRDRTAQLEAANEELEAFAYAASHDLRAPLRHICGYSAVLQEDLAGILDEKSKGFLGRIEHATKLMGQLIDDLLGLSQAARTPVNRQRVNLSTAAREICSELQSEAPGRAVEFVIADDLWDECDPGLLLVVLRNLLANAWKFTSQQTHASIEFNRLPQVDGSFHYYVRDNGVGFDMVYANKLFKPFERLNAASKFPGTGIGLTTVRRVVSKHSGRVWVEAELDVGAVFYFTLQ